MKHNLLKSLIISVILLTGVSNAWAWYVPGTIHAEHGERWNVYDNNMHEDNAITFYAVPAGTYEFQLTDGSKWSGNGCIAEAAGVTTGIKGNNATITTTETRDITITVIDGTNKKVSVTTSAPTYHVKAKWDGTNWSWKEFHNQGDGTYSLLNTYTNSKEYNYIKISSDEETYKYYKDNATLVNSPSSTSDKCIYTFNPSNGALEIRKCNTVTQPFHIYFDNSNANWSNTNEDIKFIIGHASYSRAYPLSGIENTKLFYIYMNRGDGTAYNRPDAGYYAMMEKHGTWYNGYNEGYWERKYLEYATKHSKAYLEPYNMIPNHSYILETTNTEATSPITITDKGANGLPNTTQTIKYALSEYGGTPAIMNSGTTPAKITMSSYKFESGRYDAVIAESATMNEKETTYSKTFTAAQTATTTLTVSKIVAGYKFIGWYTETGEPLSQSSTYTYYPTSNTTIYARFEYRSTVNYMESPGGKITVTYTDQNGDTQTKELRPDQQFDITTGGILNFTAQANEGYTFQGIYVKRPNHVYTNNLSDTVIVNSNITIIPEFTHNSNKKIVFLDLNTKLPVSDPNTSDENRYWTKGGAYFKVHYDGEDHDIQDWDIDNKLYYHNQHVAAGKVLIFKRYGKTDNKLKNSSPTIVTADNLNKYAIIGKAPASWTEGEWREGPTCEIMLDPFPYGEYGVRINGVEFLCYPSKTKTTEVPIGTTVEIINKKPTHEFWDFNPKYKYSVVAQPKGESVQEITSSTYTMNKDVNFGPNYGMKKGYRVYLHIPTNLTGENQWNTKPTGKDYDYYDNFIYAYDHLSNWQIWEGDGQEGKVIGELVRMTKDKYLSSLGDGEYWYVDIPAGYHTFKFERKEPNIGENTHRDRYTETFAFEMPFTEGNCYTLNKQEGEYFTGTWGTIRKPDPSKTHKVTLGWCEFGKYGVIYDGVEHYSRLPQTLEEFEVPDGAVLTFIEGTPSSDAYDGGIVLSEPQKQKIDITQSFTVYSDVTFDDNFVTKKTYDCYLAVPNNLSEWHHTEGGKEAEYFIWRHSDLKSFEMIGRTHQGVFQYAENGYKYYKFTILEGCNKLSFQHKFPKATDTENNDSHTYQSVTIDKFSIPTTDVNCFVLTGPSSGYWTKLPARNGDYRLLYVEQVVEKDKENNTVITRKKAHPSDVIKKGIALDTVSLHVYRERSYQGIKRYDEEGHDYYTTEASNAGIILQQWNGSKWIDLSHHMVFGPLEAVPELALLPGRKNAASSTNSTGYEYLYYDDGIENIKNDDHLDKGDGVWNFIVEQNNGTATIALDRTYRYTGKYYIRTAAASGGWNTYTLPDNYMTRSDVSKKNSNYSHYFVQWIIKDENVSFTIANDYGCAISDTLDADRTDLWGNQLANDKIMVGADKVLPANANVRFSWNEKTNFIHRAYIAGTTHVHDRYLVLTGKEGDNKLFGLDGQQLPAGQDGDPRYGLTENEEIFKDISNWVYYADVKMIPGAAVQLTAKYNGKTQYFIGNPGNPGKYSNTILQGTGGDKYLIRMLYDFKTNELISAYVPGDQKVSSSDNVHLITTNLMIIRQNNGLAKQLVFNNGDMETRSSDRTGYGVIEFVEDTLRNESIPYLKRCLYWISFPFDVDLTEAFGSMVYGKHWLIQEYDGAKRAAEGYWLDNDNFWKLHWDQNITLKAGHGYVLEIDINQMIKDYIIDITDTKTQVVGLYFPSKDPITRKIINQTEYTVTMDSHKCNIVHAGPLGDRTIRDSHWNVIGVPSYVNTGATFSDKTYALADVIKYYYRWDGYKDAYTAMEATEESYNFLSTYAYMVQFAGDITWKSVLQEEGPASIVAKKNSNQQQVYAIKLELQQDGNEIDKTFVRLQDEDVTRSFDFNYDLCKIINAGANIYSIITEENSPVNVAANVLPIEETIIPLGIKLDAAGEYTFAMPNGTDGIVVELIDYETNTRTNMLLDEYTINLGNGTFENRFALHVKPNKTTTSIVDVNTNSNGVRKFIIDGTLYMQKDGVLYDAQGRCVQ